MSFYRTATFYMTSRKFADLKVGDLGNVIVSCMECHLMLNVSLVTEVAGDKLHILLLSVFGSITGGGRGRGGGREGVEKGVTIDCRFVTGGFIRNFGGEEEMMVLSKLFLNRWKLPKHFSKNCRLKITTILLIVLLIAHNTFFLPFKAYRSRDAPTV
jgi:hypothetical protein